MKTQIFNHAKQCGEAECCGFVIDNKIYMPCNNISPTPTETFEISPEDWIKAEEKGEITAVVHSHPYGERILSTADQLFQQKTAVDWWLVCDNQIHKFRYMQPLIGREFKHAKTDCYTLFRDVYHLCGIELPDFDREDDWWHNGQNLYLDLLPKNGFELVEAENLQEGDVIIICLGSSTPNHAAIYVGNQQILHHCPNRLSKRDLYGGFWLDYTHSIWRYKKWQLSGFTAILNNMVISSI
ncbi:MULTISPECIES: C40 family peptidase [unclassified Gilliamella]|uniref:C40 family peptidase n=1 Tax=unclassified Gilliamella TaxID=2685620 RepID=UPI001DE20385|nr:MULTISPECIES: C40 family peptidase [unclassified Gilliamella]MBI0037749.1 phage tail protein [Gilliamella sp. B14384G10]MBI0039744.1 phage tail protein [Gilliamella sp. B14384G7]MBI0051584.1 phage tail protein [Gilliamella sp. B14384G13]MBI0054036.1 phage tail protein [Gilliamella sp. B14384H2]MBI0103007.1 phage tail protein [Gilliamella sp. W8145]